MDDSFNMYDGQNGSSQNTPEVDLDSRIPLWMDCNIWHSDRHGQHLLEVARDSRHYSTLNRTSQD